MNALRVLWVATMTVALFSIFSFAMFGVYLYSSMGGVSAIH